MTKADRKRLEGVWDRAKVINLPDKTLGIGFNDDEDPFAIMAAIGRIIKHLTKPN